MLMLYGLSLLARILSFIPPPLPLFTRARTNTHMHTHIGSVMDTFMRNIVIYQHRERNHIIHLSSTQGNTCVYRLSHYLMLSSNGSRYSSSFTYTCCIPSPWFSVGAPLEFKLCGLGPIALLQFNCTYA